MRRACAVRISNLTKRRIPAPKFVRIARRALRALGMTGEFEVVFADSAFMRRLNVRYRRKRRPADVLSFSYPDGDPRGQVFLLVGRGRIDSENLMRLLVHAVVHLKGYEHRTKEERSRMQKRETEIFNMVTSKK